MSVVSKQFNALSSAAIEASPEIQHWVAQFPEGIRTIAKTMLSHLKFVSRDVYSGWLRGVVANLPEGRTYALYPVRKLGDGLQLWSDDGEIVERPGTSLGSEDLVYSLVANLVRSNPQALLDHPSLSKLREKEVHDYVLIDDSIGSGDRVSGFINAMLKHPTFLSWWSFGLVKIHVVSFARPKESEAKIIAKMRGSDHGLRKYRKSSKIDFTSEVVYGADWLEARWGENYKHIIELCRCQTKIPKKRRFGYGHVMANIVFYHSVPNNLPGVLWCKNKRWVGLLTGRAIPDWLLALIEQPLQSMQTKNASISGEMIRLLKLVKRGVRSSRTIATRLGVDHKYAVGLLGTAQDLGLLTPQVRLTLAGLDRLKQTAPLQVLPAWDRSLYIPSSWCAGRATVQPPIKEELASLGLADSAGVSTAVDGDVGQTSLERSDAKTATPSFSVTSHSPSMSRKRRDTDGPKGPKER